MTCSTAAAWSRIGAVDFVDVPSRLQRDDRLTADALHHAAREPPVARLGDRRAVGVDELELERRRAGVQDEDAHEWFGACWRRRDPLKDRRSPLRTTGRALSPPRAALRDRLAGLVASTSRPLAFRTARLRRVALASALRFASASSSSRARSAEYSARHFARTGAQSGPSVALRPLRHSSSR
jgi:hypothetical protein